MRRLLGIAIVGLMGMGLLAAPAPAAAATRAPRVVVIVGPVEGLTDDYRSIGAAAVKEAQRWTTDVVSVVSPNATWAAVKRALQGASIVLYLGHGNGFPSPYRSTLFRPTEDGLGLNPVAGQGDDSHQYFGESFIASQIHLAPHAIVLMSHLCYASGNSEPGLPEPTVAVAQQRVDNFAAGWLAAGADAVIADTYGSPATTIRNLFAARNGATTIDRLWAAAPNANGHVQVYASTRTPGAEARIDPSGATSGFDRSLVWRPGLTASQVITATGSIVPLPIVPTSVLPSAPSLASIGVTVGVARPRPGRNRPRSRGRHDRYARRPAVDLPGHRLDDALRSRHPLAAARSTPGAGDEPAEPDGWPVGDAWTDHVARSIRSAARVRLASGIRAALGLAHSLADPHAGAEPDPVRASVPADRSGRAGGLRLGGHDRAGTDREGGTDDHGHPADGPRPLPPCHHDPRSGWHRL